MLDLRHNPGGRLVTMMEVAGIFTSGFLWRLVTTWSLPLPYPAIGPAATDLPLAILISPLGYSVVILPGKIDLKLFE